MAMCFLLFVLVLKLVVSQKERSDQRSMALRVLAGNLRELENWEPLEAIKRADYSISRIQSHYKIKDFEYTTTVWDGIVEEEILELVLKSATIMDKKKEIEILISGQINQRDAVFYKDSGWLTSKHTHERYYFVHEKEANKTGLLYVHYSVKEKNIYDQVNDLLTLTFHQVKTTISSWDYFMKKWFPPLISTAFFFVVIVGCCLCCVKCTNFGKTKTN